MYSFRKWQVFLAALFIKIPVDTAADDSQVRLVQALRLIKDTQQNYRDIGFCSVSSERVTTRRRMGVTTYVMLDQLILQQHLFRGN